MPCRFKAAFTRCRHILKMVKNVTVAKLGLAFTRCRNNLKTVRNLMVKNLLQDFDTNEMYLHPKNPSISFQSIEKCSVLIVFKCSHDAVSRMCRLEFRFQNLPSSKSAGQNCAVLCEQEAYLSHFSPFSK